MHKILALAQNVGGLSKYRRQMYAANVCVKCLRQMLASNVGGFPKYMRQMLASNLCGVVKYSGRGKLMPLPLKSKILETPGFLVTDYIKMFPL